MAETASWPEAGGADESDDDPRPPASGLFSRRAGAAGLRGHRLRPWGRGLGLARLGAGPQEPTVDRGRDGRAHALGAVQGRDRHGSHHTLGEVRGMIFHSDRAAQYLSKDFRAHCATLGTSTPSAGSARATTTARRNPSGRSSKKAPQSCPPRDPGRNGHAITA